MEYVSDLGVLERLKIAAKTDMDAKLASLLGLSRQSITKARATKSVPMLAFRRLPSMKKIALLVWRGLPDDGQRLAQRGLNTISPWQGQIFPSALAA